MWDRKKTADQHKIIYRKLGYKCYGYKFAFISYFLPRLSQRLIKFANITTYFLFPFSTS